MRASGGPVRIRHKGIENSKKVLQASIRLFVQLIVTDVPSNSQKCLSLSRTARDASISGRQPWFSSTRVSLLCHLRMGPLGRVGSCSLLIPRVRGERWRKRPHAHLRGSILGAGHTYHLTCRWPAFKLTVTHTQNSAET